MERRGHIETGQEEQRVDPAGQAAGLISARSRGSALWPDAKTDDGFGQTRGGQDGERDRLANGRDALHRERVFTIGGKLMANEHAAASSEREPFDAVILCGVRRYVENDLFSLGLETKRQAADFARSRQVRLHERR